MSKCISENALDEKKNGCVIVESMNCKNCVTKDTKLIIVGTITPPDGQNRGYFYTAPRNRLYGYLDEALGTKFKLKKLALYGASDADKQKIIEEIKQELVANIVGNPPYQGDVEDSENKTFMPSVYNLFIDMAYEISERVELIHPARFLFNAGQTPKAWKKNARRSAFQDSLLRARQ